MTITSVPFACPLFQRGLNLPTPPAVGRRVQYDYGLSQLVPTNGERRFGGDLMATKRTDEGRRHQRQDGAPSGGGTQGGGNADSGPPQPDMLPGLWMPWIERYFGAARDWINSDKPWWQVTPHDLIDNMLAGGVKQLNDIIAKDPLLGSIDQMWNANPLRKVVPIDWAEISRALRTVWLHSLRKPEKATASGADLYMTLWRSTMDTWNEAVQRWWGMAGTDQSQGPATAPSDKRFAAPEWQNNPIYRTLKELYLLASDWLLKQGEIEGMDEAERQRLNFHLRQFVDAMSPTLLLVSNPAALRRAMETGGASLADGARNLMRDLKEGKLAMVDYQAFTPGKNLATTPGKVVLRNKLIELIRYAPTTETVHQIPLLIIPPWINKFYIMDLQPKNSMVRYLVGQLGYAHISCRVRIGIRKRLRA